MTLIQQIEAFCAKHRLSERQFGELSLNDKNIIRQLREGRDLRLSTVDRLNAFMRDFQQAA
jgi:hypothetical protein